MERKTYVKFTDAKDKRCSTCANVLNGGYCPILNNYPDRDDKPEDYGCKDYCRKNINSADK